MGRSASAVSRSVSRGSRVLLRFLDPEAFVNAIAPQGDLKISRTQWAILFRVADKSRRGLLSWDDFLVFETTLKRADADYWVAFQYFDVCVSPSACSGSASHLMLMPG
jgi:hypothetical protein